MTFPSLLMARFTFTDRTLNFATLAIFDKRQEEEAQVQRASLKCSIEDSGLFLLVICDLKLKCTKQRVALEGSTFEKASYVKSAQIPRFEELIGAHTGVIRDENRGATRRYIQEDVAGFH